MKYKINVVLALALAGFWGVFFITVQAQSLQLAQPSIKEQFDKYWKLIQGSDVGFGERRSLLAAREYDKFFAPKQNATDIEAINNDDLRLLFRAAGLATFYTFDIKYSRDMSLDLAEMEKRHSASKLDYQDMYEALVNTRMFTAARKFYEAHPSVAPKSLPGYRDEVAVANNETPTILVVSTDKREMIRRSVDLDASSRIVIFVDPLCHFSANFLHAIEPYPKLNDVLKRNAIWIAPPDGVLHFDTLQKWDRAHPEQHINIMYELKEWQIIKAIQVPTFYFLQHGKVVTTVVGWPQGGNVEKLRAALKKIGLL